MLPGERAMLLTGSPLDVSLAGRDVANIVVHVLRTGERKLLIEGGNDAQFVPSGHIVYVVGGTLFAVPFDVGRLAATGGPAPVVAGVWRGGPNGLAQFAVSAAGTLMFVPGPSGSSADLKELALIDRSGRIEQRLKLAPGPHESPRISPDGTRIAVGTDDGKDANVVVYELSGTKQSSVSRSRGKTGFRSGPQTASAWCSSRIARATPESSGRRWTGRGSLSG
jgi:hypothetical protein